MIYSDPAAAAPVIMAALQQAQRILVLTHVNPDGDAIGSMLGLWHTLQRMGKTVTALASSELPEYVTVLPGIDQVQVYAPGSPLPPSDLIWMVDTASLERVGRIYDDHASTLTAQPLIIVDHHATNDGKGQLNLIMPSMASCAELLYLLLRTMDVTLTPEAATCLLLGITTDTQSFQTSSTNPQSLRVAAELLEVGADHDHIIRSVYYATPYSTLQLIGLSLSQVQREDDLIWTHISQEMLQLTAAEDEAGDDVVRAMQRVAGVRACVLFKERSNGDIKISLRSTPGIDVSVIARQWGGGGHVQAAGATLQMNLEAARQAVLPQVRAALAHAI